MPDTTTTVLRHVSVPMRDGVRLATSVYLPAGAGPFPVVFVRTAYNRVPFTGAGFTDRGMAFVVQDVRGRYGSDGEFYPFTHEEDDGADALAWIAAQPWCNGRIAMSGDSYLAATQFSAALSGTPHLCAINPRFMAGDCWKRAYYCDGAFSLGLTWSWLCFECNARTSEAALMPLFDVGEVLRSLPLLSLDERSGAGVVPYYRDYVTHARYDQQWEVLNVRARLGEVRVPTFLVAGWYDYYAGEAFANFAALREGTAPGVRDQHRLLVGRWTHGISGTSVLGEVDFGSEALAEDDCTQRWLEVMLRGGAAEEFQAAPIRLFVMGANTWRDEQEWPLARTRWTNLYMRADGRLTREAPGEEAPDEYVYDPADPVPTRGGNHSIGPYNPGLFELAPPGPYDQRTIEARAGALPSPERSRPRSLRCRP